MNKIIHIVDYWDGPLKGLCLYESRLMWFSCHGEGGWAYGATIDDDAICTPRTYTVRKLKARQACYELIAWFAFWVLVKKNSGIADLYWKIFKRNKPELYKNNKIVGAFADYEV